MKTMYNNNLKRIAIFALVVVSVTAGVLLAFRLAFFLLPFLIAFAISSLMEPLIKIITDKIRISRKIAAPIVLLLFLAVIATLFTLAVHRLITEIKSLVVSAPEFFAGLYKQISGWMSKGNDYLDWLPPEITSNLGSVIQELSNTITDFGKSIVMGAFVTATSLPEAIIFIIITILATFFMSKDRNLIISVLVYHLPQSWMNRIIAIKKDLFNAIFGYIKAALIMMVITFTVLFIGLNIIRTEYTLLLAFLIAVIDVLPILGAGSVLIPWSLYNFLTGDIRMGVSVLLLYLVVLVTRHIVEPKVLGQQIGVHPLLTLIAMYIGLRLIGLPGLILGPITFLLIRNILNAIYKNRPIKAIIGSD